MVCSAHCYTYQFSDVGSGCFHDLSGQNHMSTLLSECTTYIFYIRMLKISCCIAMCGLWQNFATLSDGPVIGQLLSCNGISVERMMDWAEAEWRQDIDHRVGWWKIRLDWFVICLCKVWWCGEFNKLFGCIRVRIAWLPWTKVEMSETNQEECMLYTRYIECQ